MVETLVVDAPELPGEPSLRSLGSKIIQSGIVTFPETPVKQKAVVDGMRTDEVYV